MKKKALTLCVATILGLSSGTVAMAATIDSAGGTDSHGMEFRAYICGNVIVKGDAADVYFTNSEKFDVWLKLRVLTADGILLGETGLIRPGEYVKSVSLTSEVEDGTAIKLKIMAYEPDTYYSAGSVTLNTILRKGGAE